jgi:hypothetical protein
MYIIIPIRRAVGFDESDDKRPSVLSVGITTASGAAVAAAAAP